MCSSLFALNANVLIKTFSFLFRWTLFWNSKLRWNFHDLWLHFVDPQSLVIMVNIAVWSRGGDLLRRRKSFECSFSDPLKMRLLTIHIGLTFRVGMKFQIQFPLNASYYHNLQWQSRKFRKRKFLKLNFIVLCFFNLEDACWWVGGKWKRIKFNARDAFQWIKVHEEIAAVFSSASKGISEWKPGHCKFNSILELLWVCIWEAQAHKPNPLNRMTWRRGNEQRNRNEL